MTDHNGKPSTAAGMWRQDFLASLVVFLVALPLCMGIALASGAPVAAGLVTGIIGGLVVGFISGSPLQVSGPAAGLSVLCYEVIREHGLPALGAVVLIAGALQLTGGLLKIGQWFRAVSPAVIHGMLSGIGVLILSSQIHVMVDDRPRESGLANLRSIPEAVWKGMQFSSLEPVGQRQAQIGFLQRFGELHEEQREIEALVARTATRHGSAKLHQYEESQLATFVPRQEALLREFRVASDELMASPISAASGSQAARAALTTKSAVVRLAAALDDLKAHRLERVEASQQAATQSLAAVLGNLKSHDWAAKIGLVAIIVIVLWQAFAPRAFRAIPGPLLAVVLVTGLAWTFALPVLYVEVPDNLIDGLTFPSLTVLEDMPLRALIVSGLMMAVIASAETLLCASAVDQMHTGPRTQYDKELAAQGIGNLLCGLVGALPMTGVIVRSAANVQAGAKTRRSAILHGVWMLVFVAALGSLLRMIPTAALAGILVFTGFKLIDWKGFVHLWKYSRTEALIFLATLVVIVVGDLLMGVVTGIILSAIKLLVTFSHLEVELTSPVIRGQHAQVVLRVAGAATFLRLPLLAGRLDDVPPGAELHVDFERFDYIDHACLDLLMNWARQHEATGGRLVIDWGQLHARFRGARRGAATTAVEHQSSAA